MKENNQPVIMEKEVLNRDSKKLQNIFTLKFIDKVIAKSENVYSFPNNEIETVNSTKKLLFHKVHLTS